MDMLVPVKAGFLGFILSVGVQLLVFYVVGGFKQVTPQNFTRTFILAAVAAFLAVDLFLYYKVYLVRTVQSQIFLVGCVGGWVGGIFFGLTQLKPVLLSVARRR